MRLRCHAKGKFYNISCPEGTRLVRAVDSQNGEVAEHDHLVVPLNGKTIRIPADPPELLPLLAESKNFGVTLVGEPEPDVMLAGVACPGCGQDDVAWLQLVEGSEAVRCDRCGVGFSLQERTSMNLISRRRGKVTAKSPGAGSQPESN